GYTPEGLLDDAVAALAAHDGAGLFGVVEQVISSGHSPRRFAEDLLERFRDLIVVLAAGESAKAVLPRSLRTNWSGCAPRRSISVPRPVPGRRISCTTRWTKW